MELLYCPDISIGDARQPDVVTFEETFEMGLGISLFSMNMFLNYPAEHPINFKSKTRQLIREFKKFPFASNPLLHF